MAVGSVMIAVQVVLSLHSDDQDAAGGAFIEAPTYHVGDCVELPGTGEKSMSTLRRSDCAADPSYTIGAVYDDGERSCESDTYERYQLYLGETSSLRLCLAANLTADHCYRPRPGSHVLERVDCVIAEGGAETYRVLLRIEADDPALCPPETEARNYPVPARTYCFGARLPVDPDL